MGVGDQPQVVPLLWDANANEPISAFTINSEIVEFFVSFVLFFFPFEISIDKVSTS